jgi:hypothetical protein
MPVILLQLANKKKNDNKNSHLHDSYGKVMNRRNAFLKTQMGNKEYKDSRERYDHRYAIAYR